MIFLIYLAVFALVFFIRYRSMSGAGMKLHVDNDGRTHFETSVSAGKKSPNFNVRIGMPCDQKLYFKIAPEGGMSRLLKAIGVADEFQSGDRETDKLLFVSDDPLLFQDILKSDGLRGALRQLVSRHKKIKIRAFGHRIWLEANGVPAGWLNQNRSDILAYLWEISNAASQSAELRADAAPRFSYAQRAAFFMVMHATLLTGAIFGFLAFIFGDMHVENLQRLIASSAVLIPLAAGIWIVLMLGALRRSMWLVLALGDFILIGLAGLILTIPLLAIEANQNLPQGPAVVQQKQLMAKQCSLHCSKKRRKRSSTSRDYPFSATECEPANRQIRIDMLKDTDSICRNRATMRYKLTFPAWRSDDNAPYVLDVDAARFDTSKRGDAFNIPVHPGALGSPWIDEDEIAPATENR